MTLRDLLHIPGGPRHGPARGLQRERTGCTGLGGTDLRSSAQRQSDPSTVRQVCAVRLSSPEGVHDMADGVDRQVRIGRSGTPP